jgi:chemotaxis-related protein WspD
MVMVDAVQIDDCWNKIGVWSKTGASCPRLVEIVHCRNCDVYSAAGRILLEREVPQEARQQWAKRYAQPVGRTLRRGTSFTVFRIGVEWLAIPTQAVKSIGDPVSIRRIPHRSNLALRGMANLAGELELVVSLEALLGIEPAVDAATQKSGRQRGRPIPRMVRVSGEESGPFAFEAAEVSGTHRHEESELEPLPSTLEKALLRYVRGTMEVGGRRVGVLDLNLVVYSVEQSLK